MIECQGARTFFLLSAMGRIHFSSLFAMGVNFFLSNTFHFHRPHAPHKFCLVPHIWRDPRFFHVVLVSALSIFIATAYDILRFTAKIEIKKYKLTLNLVTLPVACLFIHVNWSADTGQIDFLQYTDDVQVDRFPCA